jgi:DNA-binding response OmpR family regulator
VEPDKKSILIIEDNQELALAIAMFLKGNGYAVSVAYDATFGIMNTHKSKIDLVILDLGLPGGGGFYVLENIKKSVRTFDVPVIILTAKIEEGLEKKAREKGACEFFTKPCDMEKLLATIQTILH